MSRAATFRGGKMYRLHRSSTGSSTGSPTKYNEFWTNLVHPNNTLRNFVIAGSVFETYFPGNSLITLIFSLNILYFLKMTVKQYDPYYVPLWLLNISYGLPNWIKKETISSKNFNISISENGVCCKNGSFHKLFKSAFSHYDWIHLFSNLFSLTTWLGPSLIRKIGPFWFAVIYCSSGIGSGVIHTKMTPNDEALGASGCLFGLYGAINLLNNVPATAFILWMILITGCTLLLNKYYFNVKIGAYAHFGGAIVGYYTMMLITYMSISI
jgi:membrane associated rhomboid family serine protease